MSFNILQNTGNLIWVVPWIYYPRLHNSAVAAAAQPTSIHWILQHSDNTSWVCSPSKEIPHPKTALKRKDLCWLVAPCVQPYFIVGILTIPFVLGFLGIRFGTYPSSTNMGNSSPRFSYLWFHFFGIILHNFSRSTPWNANKMTFHVEGTKGSAGPGRTNKGSFNTVLRFHGKCYVSMRVKGMLFCLGLST